MEAVTSLTTQNTVPSSPIHGIHRKKKRSKPEGVAGDQTVRIIPHAVQIQSLLLY